MEDDVVDYIWSLTCEALARGTLSMWTVYDHPADFPRDFVARLFEINSGHVEPTDIVVCGTLEAIQSSLSRCGLFRMPRSEGDDPKIVETWL